MLFHMLEVGFPSACCRDSESFIYYWRTAPFSCFWPQGEQEDFSKKSSWHEIPPSVVCVTMIILIGRNEGGNDLSMLKCNKRGTFQRGEIQHSICDLKWRTLFAARSHAGGRGEGERSGKAETSDRLSWTPRMCHLTLITLIWSESLACFVLFSPSAPPFLMSTSSPHLLSSLSPLLFCHPPLFFGCITLPLCPISFSLDLIWASTFTVGFYLSNYVATHLWRE